MMMTTTMIIMRNCNSYCADQLLKRIRGRPKKAGRLPRLSRVLAEAFVRAHQRLSRAVLLVVLVISPLGF